MRHRFHFEPVDIENDVDFHWTKKKWKMIQEYCYDVWGVIIPDFSKLVTIDDDGFAIKKKKK